MMDFDVFSGRRPDLDEIDRDIHREEQEMALDEAIAFLEPVEQEDERAEFHRRRQHEEAMARLDEELDDPFLTREDVERIQAEQSRLQDKFRTETRSK